jgi:hypothetical protein
MGRFCIKARSIVGVRIDLGPQGRREVNAEIRLASVLSNTAERARNRRIQNVDHEGVGRHVPFRRQSKLRCGLKSESRIESRVADDDDERASCGSQALDPGSYEETADASPLMRGATDIGPNPAPATDPTRSGLNMMWPTTAPSMATMDNAAAPLARSASTIRPSRSWPNACRFTCRTASMSPGCSYRISVNVRPSG